MTRRITQIAAALMPRALVGRVQVLLEERARPFFDDRFYKETYADVAAPSFDRFRHFMDHGWREGRDPSSRFHTIFYRDRHLGGSNENPLLHYARDGAARGLRTRPDYDDPADRAVMRDLCAPYFSPAFYRSCGGHAGEDALDRYLHTDWRKGTAPSQLFDPTDYVDRHRFLEKQEVAPLYHLASQRRARGAAPPRNLDLFTGAPAAEPTVRVASPVLRLKPPRIVAFEPLPEVLGRELAAIWQRTEIGGDTVAAYHLADVFVVGDGLVFDKDASFVEASRHGHTDASVRDAALVLATALDRGGCETIESGILARTRGAHNYGHFLLEMLPCAWFARSHLGCSVPALIFKEGGTVERACRQALGTLGFSSEDVHAFGDEPLRVRSLVLVDGLAQHPLHISPLALGCFDEIAARVEALPYRKLYAARGGPMRDFGDEAAVAARLERAGFHRAATGTLPFETQVALFKGADHVFGIGGAALTNLLFCRPGSRVTVASPSSASEVLFWMIAALRGLDYEEFRCRERGPQRGSLSWDRTIDVTEAELAAMIA